VGRARPGESMKLGLTESDREETPYGINVMTTRAL
jgi:hypothetical protein